MGKEIKMIKTDKGQIEIEGNIASVIADVGVISNTVRDALVENGMPKEMAAISSEDAQGTDQEHGQRNGLLRRV